MGFYINELEDGTPLPKIGKADFMLNNIDGAEGIVLPQSYDVIEALETVSVIAVVENGLFDAAAYVDKHLYEQIEQEMKHGSSRKIRFLLIPREIATKLSGIDKYLE